jgi:hypothetical protein
MSPSLHLPLDLYLSSCVRVSTSVLPSYVVTDWINATYYRRSLYKTASQSVIIEQRWYAHRYSLSLSSLNF